MKSTIALLSLSLALATGAASAQQLPSVHADPEEVYLSISCQEPEPPELADVTHLLSVTNPKTTPYLRKKMMVAVAEACQAGESPIKVWRTQTGVSWEPVDSATTGDRHTASNN